MKVVPKRINKSNETLTHTHTHSQRHTHTHMYIYIRKEFHRLAATQPNNNKAVTIPRGISAGVPDK